ncbi:MAG: cysteine methyltransferase [Crocinitomicaceae bacterium]|nr:cysteine methyltransferase [Crocinitomicaceae bacterium]
MATLPQDEFKRAVYDLTRLIPAGRVSTYGAIARCIGASGASRRVGWALNQCFGEMPPVPAHRVVNRLGLLTGAVHFPVDAPMVDQLRAEGVEVFDNQVMGFDGVFWDPWKAGEW